MEEGWGDRGGRRMGTGEAGGWGTEEGMRDRGQGRQEDGDRRGRGAGDGNEGGHPW